MRHNINEIKFTPQQYIKKSKKALQLLEKQQDVDNGIKQTLLRDVVTLEIIDINDENQINRCQDIQRISDLWRQIFLKKEIENVQYNQPLKLVHQIIKKIDPIEQIQTQAKKGIPKIIHKEFIKQANPQKNTHQKQYKKSYKQSIKEYIDNQLTQLGIFQQRIFSKKIIQEVSKKAIPSQKQKNKIVQEVSPKKIPSQKQKNKLNGKFLLKYLLL